jgi:mannose-1-phosphate guanylyltransferase/phosphomannomutase
VRLAPGDPDSVEIRFLGRDGSDIDASTQRKVERLLGREDYRRAFGGEIGDIVFPPRALEFYTAAMERSVDLERVRERRFKIVLDYSFGAVSMLMPSLLTSLAAEVLAVNPYASTASATEFVETRDASVGRVAELVRVSGSDLGFVIDPDGELATLVDGRGRVLEPDQVLLTMVTLVTEAVERPRIAVPVNVTQAVDRIVGERGSVVRTRIWGDGLTEAAAQGATFAGSADGGCMWPDFLPAFDAAVTLAKLLDLLAVTDRRLADVVDGLPTRHVVHETVMTPWERKGTVMREIVQRTGAAEVELIDGVKILGPGRWALVLPDPEEALTHVWAEAGNDVESRRLAQEWAQRIRESLR